jgi:hypothetical protein
VIPRVRRYAKTKGSDALTTISDALFGCGTMPVLYVGQLLQMRKSEVNTVCTVALLTAADAQITNQITNYRSHDVYRSIV